MTDCDKCGLEVPEGNNAVVFDSMLTACAFKMLFAQPRHLLPVVANGRVLCEGSPSRAQYLEGQARDTRLEYPYKPEREEIYRKAYRELQIRAQQGADYDWGRIGAGLLPVAD